MAGAYERGRSPKLAFALSFRNARELVTAAKSAGLSPEKRVESYDVTISFARPRAACIRVEPERSVVEIP
jgi:hypothetical protein